MDESHAFVQEMQVVPGWKGWLSCTWSRDVGSPLVEGWLSYTGARDAGNACVKWMGHMRWGK